MQRIVICFALVCALVLAFGLAGCTQPAGSSSSPPVEQATSQNDHGEHSHGADAGDGQSAMDKMKTELAKLTPEDAASAEMQHMCPVSGEMLGTMGPPKKVEVNGQQVWICCEHCEEKLMANPDEYLAKLHKE